MTGHVHCCLKLVMVKNLDLNIKRSAPSTFGSKNSPFLHLLCNSINSSNKVYMTGWLCLFIHSLSKQAVQDIVVSTIVSAVSYSPTTLVSTTMDLSSKNPINAHSSWSVLLSLSHCTSINFCTENHCNLCLLFSVLWVALDNTAGLDLEFWLCSAKEKEGESSEANAAFKFFSFFFF